MTTARLRFGASFIADMDFPLLSRTAREAEDQRYDCIWIGDAPLTPAAYSDDFKTTSEAIVAMAVCLAATTRVRVAHAVLLVTLRDPIVTAKALAYASRASGGRVDLGAGLGWRDEEYAYFGVRKSDRGRRMDAALDTMAAFFRGDASFENDFYRWFDAVPLPVLEVPPFTWIGGTSRAAMERALRRGAGWLPTGLWMDDFEELATEYLARGGVRLGSRVRVAPTPAEIDRGVGGAVAVAELIASWAALGVTDFSLVFGRDPDAQRRHQEWFADQIMPDFTTPDRENPIQ